MKRGNSKSLTQADMEFLSRIQETILFSGNRADNYLQLLNGTLGVLIVLSIGSMITYYHNLTLYSRIGGWIICLTIFTCLLINLVGIMPKTENKSNKANIFFFRSILKNRSSWEDYSQELKNIIGNKDKVVDAYALEIWNLGNVELRKFDNIKIVSLMLLSGLILGSFFIMVSVI